MFRRSEDKRKKKERELPVVPATIWTTDRHCLLDLPPDKKMLETIRFDYECELHYEYDFLETIKFDYECELHYEYDFLEIIRFDYECELHYEYDFLETIRFDYECEFEYEYDLLETFRFDYEYDLLERPLDLTTSMTC